MIFLSGQATGEQERERHKGCLGRAAPANWSTRPLIREKPTSMSWVIPALPHITFVAKVAEAAGVQITRERVALWGRALFDALDQLTDGVPVQESGNGKAVR
jgi:hypothetical protein